ncbi:SchA/CurD-like domain-containing protein, partial [Streptacidiphilus griseoplanus]|uniref:SchA/CurD-like domain-containing protein n=1 Tax=Peterkaempfera griseoplana TaxID=66896 RepID=UPI0006E246C0
MTALSESPTLADQATSRLRVVLLCDVNEGQQQRFLDAYEQIRHQVAAVPGHISDQLCQSIEEPTRWLITSEWDNAAHFLSWVDSAEHRELVKPLHGCVRDTRSLRFTIARETPEPGDAESARRHGGGQRPAGQGRPGGTVRHAITFTVKPGSEEAVAEILAGYTSPRARVDEHTRLLRTSLYMHGNRVVRAVEVEGDLGAALRHVAQQPEVRAVEEAINPHLEEARDFADPGSVQSFFARAALPAVHHCEAAGAVGSGDLRRRALIYPVRRGCAQVAAKLLAGHDEQAVQDPANPLVRATVFQREDILVRVVDLRTGAQ